MVVPLLLPRPTTRRYLDHFGGGAVDLGTWTLVDTQSYASVASSLLSFSEGTGNQGDPMVERKLSHARLAGLAFEAKVRAGGTAEDGPDLVLATATPYDYSPTTEREHGLTLASTGTLRALRQATAVTLPFSYAANTWYWLRIILRATGADLFFSTDGVYFYRAWNEPAGGASPLYDLLMTYNQAGDVDYVAKPWVRSGPSAILSGTPAALSLSLGSELVVNGNMELDANWTNAGTPTTNAQSSEQAHAGTYSRKLVTDAVDEATQSDTFSTTAGAWYLETGWAYVTAGNILIRTAIGTAHTILASASAAWTQGTFATRESSTSATRRVLCYGHGGADTAYFDDISVQPITLASMHSLLGDAGVKAGLFECRPTVTAGYQDGMAICVTDETNPTYELQCWIDRTNVVLVKRENDVETVLINTATGVTYTAGRKLRVVIMPVAGSANSSVAVYYESAANVFTQIGTTQTVDLSLYSTRVCGFGTEDAAQPFGLVEAWGGMYA